MSHNTNLLKTLSFKNFLKRIPQFLTGFLLFHMDISTK